MPRPPRLYPDYSGLVIPPNVAPLNFRVEERGNRYRVRVRAARKSLEVSGASPRVVFALRAWEELLQSARGGTLNLEVSARGTDGRWQQFQPVTNRVARDEIDRYLVYRRIRPFYNLWTNVGIYQRDLTCFQERPILRGAQFGNGCLNCHAFSRNRADSMSVGIRSEAYGGGTLVAREGRVTKFDAKWGYTSWHPNGRLAAYSVNQVRQFFHPAGTEIRDVVDLDSDIAVQEFPSSKVTATKAFADPDRLETYPAWSADGRALWFCSARFPWKRRDRLPPARYDQLRYDLARVSYNPKTGAWGQRQTVVSSERTGLSILLPRPSPDGRFLLFCMCRYGGFPIYQPGSDLYLMDLASGRYRRAEVNSDRAESWHCWSSNSRWIAFSSKRNDGVFTRTYLSHVDADGRMSRPFVVPQEDPEYYDSCLDTFSVPELITQPVSTSARALARAARSRQAQRVAMPPLSAAAIRKAPGGSGADDPYQAAPGR